MQHCILRIWWSSGISCQFRHQIWWISNDSWSTTSDGINRQFQNVIKFLKNNTARQPRRTILFVRVVSQIFEHSHTFKGLIACLDVVIFSCILFSHSSQCHLFGPVKQKLAGNPFHINGNGDSCLWIFVNARANVYDHLRCSVYTSWNVPVSLHNKIYGKNIACEVSHSVLFITLFKPFLPQYMFSASCSNTVKVFM